MAAANTSKHHDVIIIGAGFNGIVAAKTYLQVKPSVDILIVDDRAGVGGVWSKERLYPGLFYEMPAPLLNFTDFDMCKELGVEMWGDVSGLQVNEFLVGYAQKHDIFRRCRLSTEAVMVERAEAGWIILVWPAGDSDASLERLSCNKLIVATGLNSRPKMPNYDLSNFDGISFHALEIGKRYPELLNDVVQHVTIVGGHKSALEAVGTCAQSGKEVDWLINENGSGPSWLLPSRNQDGSSFAEMATKRFPAILSPSVYHSSRVFDRFLHSGRWWLGTWLLRSIWGATTKRLQRDMYTKSENGRKLKPDPDSFYWFAPGGTVLHDRDLETLRLVDEGKLIHVNRAHIFSATGHSITLSTGDSINSDAIIFCTGWNIASLFLFSPTLAQEIGLPFDPEVLSEDESEYWRALDETAMTRIEADYPMLKNPPSNIYVREFDKTPFRLFRYIIPPSLAARGDRSILFLGAFSNARSYLSAEIASLWSVAYFENLLPASTNALLADKNEMDKDIAHVEAYRKKRYSNAFLHRLNGSEAPEFDDLMMNDLGLRTDRKRMRMTRGWRGWFGLKAWVDEWFGNYLASDYEGLVEEFLESLHKRRSGLEASILDSEVRDAE